MSTEAQSRAYFDSHDAGGELTSLIPEPRQPKLTIEPMAPRENAWGLSNKLQAEIAAAIEADEQIDEARERELLRKWSGWLRAARGDGDDILEAAQ